MTVDGESLGISMTPADIFIAVHQLLDLGNDELLAVFAEGAGRIEAGTASHGRRPG